MGMKIEKIVGKANEKPRVDSPQSKNYPPFKVPDRLVLSTLGARNFLYLPSLSLEQRTL